MAILETKNLTKHYGSRKVLSDVSVSMQEGSVYGLLGPNGAGKTTFLRLINNIIVRDSGEVYFKGEPLTRKHGSLMGYMPEERGLYAKMQVEDQIMYFGLLKGGNKQRLREVMHEYMDIFSVSQADGKRKVQELSKGNQQKVQIISTLVHEPELVMLDEPFSGFDPINGALLTSLIERLKQRGATIVLSSHNMAAVEEMCSHMALINSGRLLVDGEIADIKRANHENILLVKATTSVNFDSLASAGTIKYATLLPRDNRDPFTYHVKTNGSSFNNEVARTICMQSQLLHFEEKLPTLSELFIKYTEQGKEAPKLENMEFEKIN